MVPLVVQQDLPGGPIPSLPKPWGLGSHKLPEYDAKAVHITLGSDLVAGASSADMNKYMPQ